MELLKLWAGNPPVTVLSDAQLGTLLDQHSFRVQAHALIPDDADASSTTDTTFRSPYTGWLSVVLLDEGGAVLSAATSDLAAGKWTFTVAQDYVQARGVVADVHAAAADAWAVRLAGVDNWKGQFATKAREMVRYHQARTIAKTADAVRADLGEPSAWR